MVGLWRSTKDGNTVLVVADVVGQKGVHEFSGAKDGLPRVFGGIVPSDDNDGNEFFFLGGSPSVPSSTMVLIDKNMIPALYLSVQITRFRKDT